MKSTQPDRKASEGERTTQRFCYVLESYDKDCKHEWEYIRRIFRGDLLICKKCGGFKRI